MDVTFLFFFLHGIKRGKNLLNKKLALNRISRLTEGKEESEIIIKYAFAFRLPRNSASARGNLSARNICF